MPTAQLTTVAQFPEHYFLENLAVRADDSVLVTAMNQRELWYVPSVEGDAEVQAQLMHTFDHPATTVVETAPDVFLVAASEIYTNTASFLHRVDLRHWKTGDPVPVTEAFAFDERAKAINGGCLITPSVLLLADSSAGLIWRVDLPPDGGGITAEVWLAHESMTVDRDRPMKPPQPGINGLGYDPRTSSVYYTSTSRELFMRVAVDPGTHAAAGDPVQVGGGTMADDFCIDEHAGVAYLATHRENTIDRVVLAGPADQDRVSVAGNPLDEQLLGPSSGRWSRTYREPYRRAYFISDGGTTNPLPDGSVRTAKLLRVDLPHF